MKIDVKHTAKLANLPLDPKEIKKLQKQLSEILVYVEQLEKVDTKGVEPTSQTTGLEGVYDEDVARGSLSFDAVFSQAKNKDGGLFKVKGVFEDE
jgi:aspartyl-tRNA(Asn)/glutamyl-tRNA(Gln) amidotransferase subunit C